MSHRNRAILQYCLIDPTVLDIPAAYRLVHITREAFHVIRDMDPTFLESIQPTTVHCFCAVFVPQLREFCNFDATEKLRSTGEEHLLLEFDIRVSCQQCSQVKFSCLHVAKGNGGILSNASLFLIPAAGCCGKVVGDAPT